jgi:hypothetical protein
MILVFRARPPVGLAVQVSLRREVPGLHSFKVPRASVTVNVRRAPGAGSAVALDQYACRRGVVVGSRFSRALDPGGLPRGQSTIGVCGRLLVEAV